MSEFWVSQGKHFCKVCQSWMSSHPVNIKRHEVSERHLVNQAKMLRDMRAKERAKEMQTNEASKMIREMEREAYKSLQYDWEYREQPQENQKVQIYEVAGGYGMMDPLTLSEWMNSHKDTSVGKNAWVVCTDPTTKQVYYHNKASKKSTWEKPHALVVQEQQAAEAKRKSMEFKKKYACNVKWVVCTDSLTGGVYFFDRTDGKSVWETPVDLNIDLLKPPQPPKTGKPHHLSKRKVELEKAPDSKLTPSFTSNLNRPKLSSARDVIFSAIANIKKAKGEDATDATDIGSNALKALDKRLLEKEEAQLNAEEALRDVDIELLDDEDDLKALRRLRRRQNRPVPLVHLDNEETGRRETGRRETENEEDDDEDMDTGTGVTGEKYIQATPQYAASVFGLGQWEAVDDMQSKFDLSTA
eukprot:Platyproteum_vivax@DN12844_c0_g1_i1.p1